MNTRIINLFGGPCAGKSTVRADVFRLFKQKGYEIEEVHEHAKKLTWSDRMNELSIQPYVFGKQLRDTEALIGKVDIIVNDSPLWLSAFYGKRYPHPRLSKHFVPMVVEMFKNFNPQFNYFILPVGEYNPKGRNQTQAEAEAFTETMMRELDSDGIDYKIRPGDDFCAQRIVEDVIADIERNKSHDRFWSGAGLITIGMNGG